MLQLTTEILINLIRSGYLYGDISANNLILPRSNCYSLEWQDILFVRSEALKDVVAYQNCCCGGWTGKHFIPAWCCPDVFPSSPTSTSGEFGGGGVGNTALYTVSC